MKPIIPLIYPECIAKSRLNIRGFLSALTPEVHHRNISNQLTLRTGGWFLESREFKRWVGVIGSEEDKETESRVLCCLGIPGVGKTSLAYILSFLLLRMKLRPL
jgi:hypothetical protein